MSGVEPTRLEPLPIRAGDQSALHRDGCNSDTWPEHKNIDLRLGPAMPHVDGVRLYDYDAIGEIGLENVPDGFLGKLALGEVRVRRNEAQCGVLSMMDHVAINLPVSGP